MINNPRWKQRPAGSNWGEFGAFDEIGRMNLITNEIRLDAVKTVEHGKAFCLSLPLDLPGGSALNPRRHPPRLFATERDGRENYHFPLSLSDPGATDIICDDLVLLYNQYSTQWDSLAHYGASFDVRGDGIVRPTFYNGWLAGTDIHASKSRQDHRTGAMNYEGVRADRLGIDKLAQTSVQGRGILVDLETYWGCQPENGIGGAELIQILQQQNVAVRAGDLLCLHTGFSRRLLDRPQGEDVLSLHALCPALNGGDAILQRWITESGIAAVIADNYAVERINEQPHPLQGPRMPLHELCLYRLGIHLGELWYLAELADWLKAHRRHAFLLTAPPLRLPGAVGSPATPVATV